MALLLVLLRRVGGAAAVAPAPRVWRYLRQGPVTANVVPGV
ncbi:hypothetical protein M2283_008416 [Streptomyces pseudovenezuelae]|uniref:Uncharacterized protein n=1 Tax=Streptomyces pseudovenezuelae TaxID=67350 RepID=A0ABT6LZ30_9ACTN|nr:hypothetical protein [Streptomyces pseudovenezuelae]